MENSEKHEGDMNLSALLKRGGVHPQVAGKTVTELVRNLSAAFPAAQELREKLVTAALERESLMTTAAGRGIALPHPRNPLIESSEDQFVAVGYCAEPVDWNALDGKPVTTVFFIASSSPREHLHTLSRVNYFCRNPNFCALLEERAPLEELLAAIARAEETWSRPQKL
jgi:PTS system nitrogen regulatory IIA component